MGKPQVTNQVIIRNDEDHTIYHQGVAIPAGETKIFSGSAIPGQPAPPPEGVGIDKGPRPERTVQDMLGDTVPKIVNAVSGLSDEQLDAAEALENANDKPRKGVIEAIEAERLARAVAELDTSETGSETETETSAEGDAGESGS